MVNVATQLNSQARAAAQSKVDSNTGIYLYNLNTYLVNIIVVLFVGYIIYTIMQKHICGTVVDNT